MNIYLGVDTGGTFTDFVLIQNDQFTTHKVLSTPDAPERAILTGIHDLKLNSLATDEQLYVIHGSTVATNAVLEGKGVKTVYITNRGFKDILTLGRQARPELYNLQPKKIAPPVAAEYCLETGGRISATGETLQDLNEADLDQLCEQIEQINPRAVAINCLFSYLDASVEKRIEAAINQLGRRNNTEVFVSRSSKVLPEYKEYERGITTWLNAYVGPLVKGYLLRLQKGIPTAQIAVMQSAGNTIAAEHAGEQAVHMLLSGPAGGLAAAESIGKLIQQSRQLTFDMGGTSTDVALIEAEIQLTSESKIANYPVAIPMVDMHTIGAGGGSIAYIDEGGLLQVGPESAGANPGPACYAQGGHKATVTDANLILGRLLIDGFLGGAMTLSVDAAYEAINRLAMKLKITVEQTAEGIIKIANEHMASALRVMSVQRGVDPRGLTLTSFGGAGGLHVCALAEALQMKAAMVPVQSGVLSALGMLMAAKGRELSRTLNSELTESAQIKQAIDVELEQLIQQGIVALQAESVSAEAIEISTSLDCRYKGQSYTLNIEYNHDSTTAISESQQLFIKQHQQRYGHSLELAIELVNVRVSLKANSQAVELETRTNVLAARPYTRSRMLDTDVDVYKREQLAVNQTINGPALISETTATIYVAPDWQCYLDEFGNLRLSQL